MQDLDKTARVLKVHRAMHVANKFNQSFWKSLLTKNRNWFKHEKHINNTNIISLFF